ncbi:MAG TPA: hypothetical protein PLG47_02240 [Candidatus Dojkabacteria bacterium]|nr:hypothetical protein [Candidatus Dojkabacteria bacterium]
MTNESGEQGKFISTLINPSSNIFRVGIVVVLFILYYLFLSPFVESFLLKQVTLVLRSGQRQTLNVLSPVYDIYANSKEYNFAIYDENLKSKNISNTKFFTVDPRVLAMNKFLISYHSPMATSAETFIVEADKHGLDWRLIASISGVESAFGNITPKGSNNAWGWRGINGNEDGWSMFPTWDDAIIHITERFSRGYGTTMTPFEIEPIYCPPCGASPEHAWANGVSKYMLELQYYLDNLDKL